MQLQQMCSKQQSGCLLFFVENAFIAPSFTMERNRRNQSAFMGLLPLRILLELLGKGTLFSVLVLYPVQHAWRHGGSRDVSTGLTLDSC